jgi:Domain of unknown function (DUF4868)
MDEDILAPDQAEVDNYQETDIFAWATNSAQFKNDLTIELFLLSKSYIPYKTKVSKELHKQLEPLFIDSLIEYVLNGAETGLIVRGFEEAESEEMVLQRTQLFKVDKAREALNWIKFQEHELEVFNDEEHDFSRIRGVIARVTHPEIGYSMYVVKALPRSNVMRGKVGWMLREGTFVPFDADAALRIPADNQLLIIDQDIYVFSQSKLKQLFGYDAKEASVAEQKIAAIESHFQLTYPEGMTLQQMLTGKKSTIKKLQKIDPTSVTQQALLDHAEELDIDLMADDSGAIILMDTKDVDRFVNLLNDDYVESALTGQRYEIVRKRPLKPDEEEQQL